MGGSQQRAGPARRASAGRVGGRAGVLAIAWVLCWLALASANAYEPVTVEVRAVKVTERSYYVQGGPGPAAMANQGFTSNAGFIVTPEGVVVVDALGTVPLGEALLRAIREVTPLPVRYVVVTHYHADHFYGLEPLKKAGAEVWAHRDARIYLAEGEGERRLAERTRSLAPWVTGQTLLIGADKWLESDTSFRLGGLTFDIVHLGPAHSPEDVVVVVREEGVLFSGDLIFTGRIPFVGNADSKRWLAMMDRLLELKPRLMVPGHGRASPDAAQELALTRDYLLFLRETMGKAVADFVAFDEAYAAADWSRFSHIPAFEAANRVNAYGTYLLLERELLQKP